MNISKLKSLWKRIHLIPPMIEVGIYIQKMERSLHIPHTQFTELARTRVIKLILAPYSLKVKELKYPTKSYLNLYGFL